MLRTNDKMKSDFRRMRISIEGAVQGVGFRPFVYRLARELELTGWVRNGPRGVNIEIEGENSRLDQFLATLNGNCPPLARIDSLSHVFIEPAGYTDFIIAGSESDQEKIAHVLPDIATCADCLEEIRNPNMRRYRYPFTNCTNCGPRFTIINSLPYDRENTSMVKFAMCPDCRAEYENPLDRRFHAQPIACPNCGPSIELWKSDGSVMEKGYTALEKTAELIAEGKLCAIKGLGGFHLVVDAANDDAVMQLRKRKGREEKPFAMMFPSIDAIEAVCEISDSEKEMLLSPQAPIMLLKRKKTTSANIPIAESVAPANPYYGIMLPYTPLHHLLMDNLARPVIATSGNFSDEPICIDEYEALSRLGKIADFFLVHNRPIVRHVDDSIATIVYGQLQILRRARGYAPLPIAIGKKGPPVLALGGHLKNTVAISIADKAFVSQHIGDLETKQAYGAFEAAISGLEDLYGFDPSIVAHDLHPDYTSTQYAKRLKGRKIMVQHHYAHVLSCMADNGIAEPCLGICWDGTGYGTDGTIWGGEFLLIDDHHFTRFAKFRGFRLPGGEKAIREPRRSAIGVLFEIFGEKAFETNGLPPFDEFSSTDRAVIKKMLINKVNSPETSSAGRLFDAVASICGIRQCCTFEGQAAMGLEYIIGDATSQDCYDLEIWNNTKPLVVDWSELFKQLIEDVHNGTAINLISLKFHNTLAHLMVSVAKMSGQKNIILSGGCFQNRYLSETASHLLEQAGFRVFRHKQIPPNDGGISLGQIMAARKIKMNMEKSNVLGDTGTSD